METPAQSAQFTGSVLGPHRHICAFFNSIDEQHRVLRPFITDGFADGDKAFHYVDPERREEHLSWLAEAGINVPEVMDTGQLEVQPWRDATLRGGRFDLETWLSTFEEVLQSGPAVGTGRQDSSVTWNGRSPTCRAPKPHGVRNRVNYVIPKYEDTVVCTYDLTKFGASAVMEALRTHPA